MIMICVTLQTHHESSSEIRFLDLNNVFILDGLTLNSASPLFTCATIRSKRADEIPLHCAPDLIIISTVTRITYSGNTKRYHRVDAFSDFEPGSKAIACYWCGFGGARKWFLS